MGELFNNIAIRHPPRNPEDHADWGFNIPEIEALIPLDALDKAVMPVFGQVQKDFSCFMPEKRLKKEIGIMGSFFLSGYI